jgi:hypothetical protein
MSHEVIMTLIKSDSCSVKPALCRTMSIDRQELAIKRCVDRASACGARSLGRSISHLWGSIALTTCGLSIFRFIG